MQIDARHNHHYKWIDVYINVDNTKMYLGNLSYAEAESLAKHLKEVSEELMYYIPPEKEEDANT